MTDPHNRSNKSLHDDISETENYIEINEKVKIKEQNFIFLILDYSPVIRKITIFKIIVV